MNAFRLAGFTQRPLGVPLRRGSAPVLCVLSLLLLATACDTRPTPELPPTGAAPQWPEEEPELVPVVAESLPADAGTTAGGEEGTATTTEPAPRVTRRPALSLKERFEAGAHIRRDVRIERRYRVRVQSGLAATAQGASELRRVYTVDVENAVGGQIIGATLTIEQDAMRVLAVGESRPERAAVSGQLEGLRLSCLVQSDGGYHCSRPDDESGAQLDLTGIVPQRTGMFPGRPASLGQTWEIDGRDAEIFLGIPGSDSVVRFTLDETETAYRDDICHHVSYTFGGSQPLVLSGHTLSASVTGTGEYYHCRTASAVVYHRQEREVNVEAPVARTGTRTPIERFERIVLEEQTVIERL